MPEWTHIFDQKAGDADADKRLNAAAFHRNHEPIAVVLKAVLGEDTGDVVEIGSGTGQHVVAFAAAFPRLTWWPTDYHQSHVDSITAWRDHADLDNIGSPVVLDAAADWVFGLDEKPPLGELRAVVAINVCHISPYAVTRGILAGAGKNLRAGGHLVIYGPFMRDGEHIADSNRRFDASLRARDPEWGVRDTNALSADAGAFGLTLADIQEMPSNNFCLIFEKS